MRRRARPRLVLGRDYTLDDRGRAIFTRDYLLSMGSCCGNGCLNCPYPDCSARNRPNPPDTASSHVAKPTSSSRPG